MHFHLSFELLQRKELIEDANEKLVLADEQL